MEVVEVAELPWPHHPSRCRFWRRLRENIPPELREIDSEEVRAILERATRSLPAHELARCPYHRTDWRRAAEAAIDCWSALHATDALAVEEWLITTAGLEGDTLEGAASFFSEPIFVNGTQLGAGQHRVCAMKLGGVLRCLVEP